MNTMKKLVVGGWCLVVGLFNGRGRPLSQMLVLLVAAGFAVGV